MNTHDYDDGADERLERDIERMEREQMAYERLDELRSAGFTIPSGMSDETIVKRAGSINVNGHSVSLTEFNGPLDFKALGLNAPEPEPQLPEAAAKSKEEVLAERRQERELTYVNAMETRGWGLLLEQRNAIRDGVPMRELDDGERAKLRTQKILQGYLPGELKDPDQHIEKQRERQAQQVEQKVQEQAPHEHQVEQAPEYVGAFDDPFATISRDAKSQNLVHEAENPIIAGPDVNERNDLGQTPLMQHLAQLGTWEATHTGQQVDHERVEGLLKDGADPTLADHQGNTPLHCKGIDLNTIEMLQAHGADINARNALDETPLHIQAKDIDVQELVSRGAAPSINAQDREGRTPLMRYLEARSGDVSPEYVGRFLDAGADPLAVDRSGKSVMEYTGQNVEAGDVVQKHIEAHQEPVLLAHERLFNDFKERVRGPSVWQDALTPNQQAQQAHAPSLGTAAVSRNVELPNFRKQPETQSQDRVAPSRNVELPNFRKHAEPEHEQKGARFVDLPLPQRGAQDREVSAGAAFNQETTRRASARMAPTLGQQAQATGYAPKAPEVEAQDQGQQGKGQGGRERPNDPSYYTQFSQSVALPKRDEQAAEKQAARRAVDRSRGRGLGGVGR